VQVCEAKNLKDLGFLIDRAEAALAEQAEHSTHPVAKASKDLTGDTTHARVVTALENYE